MHHIRSKQRFDSVSIDFANNSPVEVTLIEQLETGTGTKLIESMIEKQRNHPNFIDELDEPSAKIGDIHEQTNNFSTLYTFAVNKNGHPFHRHRGNRVFTAISGSLGTLLRFSLTSLEEPADFSEFMANLHHVIVPADCLFTVRFGSGTWHQFLPMREDGMPQDPALFAISCHPNELVGIHEVKQHKVKAKQASIPMLTELLPKRLQTKLDNTDFVNIQTTSLTP